MGRLGFATDEVCDILDQLQAISWITEVGLMTHLANADEPADPMNQQQLALLEALAQQATFSEVSVLNSGGVCALNEFSFDRVRPGLMLYGASPLQKTSAAELDLRPAMTLSAELISVKTLKQGHTIGYGSTHRLDADTRIGVVACGYGDGYPRHAKTGTPVLINNVLAPLIGRVSMDMLVIDLTDVSAKVGDRAVLWGDGNSIEEIAAASGTIAYELMCSITTRVHREVLDV
jgi:alanine racemase